MTWAIVRSVSFWFAVLTSVHAETKDHDLPSSLAPAPVQDIETCEGFFTLKRPSLLVIGSEERLDALIADGELPDQTAVDRFDQERFARERDARARLFLRNPKFDGSREIPPGLRLQVRDKALFTASIEDQPTQLVRALREIMALDQSARWITVDDDGQCSPTSTDPRVLGRRWREIFHVRHAESVAPTPEDYARLSGARRATGLLVVRAGGTSTLVVYE